MSSRLCGWIGGADAAADRRAVLEQMAAPCGAPSTVPPRYLFGSAAALSSTGADVFQKGPLLAAVCGHPTFSDPELADRARHEGVARAFVEEYVARSVDAIKLLRGDFSVAVMNEQTGEAVLAIDRMGIHQLSYGVAGDRLVFGSTLDQISAFPGIASAINHQAIYDYVHFHMVPAPRTIHTGRHRLLPGHFLLWRNGTATSRPYWQMRFTENRNRPFSELKETFLGLLRESVREAATNGKVGAFLSGGTDSSTLAGLLTEVTGHPARTYSIGFEAEGYDEMEYARIAARHFGTHQHEYYVTPDDVVAAIPRIAAVHDQPFGNSSAVPTFFCAKLARDNGTDTLLGGDGGDELFGGNVRYARQYIYSLYSDLPEALRKGLIEPIVLRAPAIGIAGKVQRYMINASQPMPARYDDYNLLERLGAANVFTADFLATVDVQQPQTLFAHTYQQTPARTLINRMLALDLKFTLADNDLPKVTRSCELAGVDVRFPMLQDALVAFSAQLPAEYKLKQTHLRYFFKKALRGYLPDEIIRKKKHGFGLPFGLWLQTHRSLQQIALDSLTDLKKRHIVRHEFIDELTSRYVQSHAPYYGTMVWILVMLEQWFRQHPAAA